MLKFLYQVFNSLEKVERQIFSGASLIFAVSALMLGILVFQTKTAEVPAESNYYTEGIIGQPVSINPAIAGNNGADQDLIKLLFGDLIDLAAEYKSSLDGQTWNITLKEGLKWSDGKPLNSDDVLYTMDIIQNPDTRSPLLATWQGVIANRISEREVEFTIRNPYAFFLDNLKDFKIIPKHIFGAIPPENFRLSNFNLEPVGSGPYKFSLFEKRNNGFINAYYLTINPYFAGKKPFIKNITLKFYSNESELVNAFNLKRVDGFAGLNPKNIGALKLNRQVLEKNMPRYYAIFLNKNSKPSLNDANVITALNLSTDKEKMIKEIFDGKAMATNQPVPPIVEGYSKKADPGNEFSLEKAKDILEKAGWLVNQETGAREKKIGRQTETLEFSLIVPQIPFLAKTAEIIKAEWKQIGVKLNLIIMNPADIANEVIKTRNYQMILFGNILRDNPDIFSFWHSSERFYPGLNLSLYGNKKVDTLLESLRKNPDKDSRNKQLAEIQKLIVNDQPAIFLYSPTYLYAAPAGLGGFEETAINTPADRFENINDWYLATKRVFK